MKHSKKGCRKINFKSSILHSSLGFTLVELLVVITVIGLLTTMGLVMYVNASKKGRDGRREADLEQMRTALELYYSDNSVYPATSDLLVPDYIREIPADPKSTQYRYRYVPAGSDQQYAVCAHVEATVGSDNSSLCGGSSLCGTDLVPETCNYVVENP